MTESRPTVESVSSAVSSSISAGGLGRVSITWSWTDSESDSSKSCEDKKKKKNKVTAEETVLPRVDTLGTMQVTGRVNLQRYPHRVGFRERKGKQSVSQHCLRDANLPRCTNLQQAFTLAVQLPASSHINRCANHLCEHYKTPMFCNTHLKTDWLV